MRIKTSLTVYSTSIHRLGIFLCFWACEKQKPLKFPPREGGFTRTNQNQYQQFSLILTPCPKYKKHDTSQDYSLRYRKYKYNDTQLLTTTNPYTLKGSYEYL